MAIHYQLHNEEWDLSFCILPFSLVLVVPKKVLNLFWLAVKRCTTLESHINYAGLFELKDILKLGALLLERKFSRALTSWLQDIVLRIAGTRIGFPGHPNSSYFWPMHEDASCLRFTGHGLDSRLRRDLRRLIQYLIHLTHLFCHKRLSLNPMLLLVFHFILSTCRPFHCCWSILLPCWRLWLTVFTGLGTFTIFLLFFQSLYFTVDSAPFFAYAPLRSHYICMTCTLHNLHYCFQPSLLPYVPIIKFHRKWLCVN